MEKEEFSKDDLLGRLIRQSPLESPSDDFVSRVMAGIRVAPVVVPDIVPETAQGQKSYLQYLKSAAPYALLVVVFIVVFSTSDLPFLNWLPGKSYYMNNLVPYLGTLFAGLKNAFSSRYVSFGMLIVTSTALLYFVDRFFSRRSSV
jgi:hypothetical protein